MKTLRLFFTALPVILASTVSAQDYDFKVLAHNGPNQVKSGADWSPLKTGATLQKGDEVRLGENSYVGLVHKSGKPVEVKQAGVYTVDQLEAKLPAGSGALKKYTDFILSSADDAQRNRLTATGAVTRTSSPAAPGAIRVFLPENTAVFNKTIRVEWEADAAKGPFVVTVMNLFEDVVHKAVVDANEYSVDLADPKLSQEPGLLIQVTSKSDQKVASKRHRVRKLAVGERDRVAAELDALKREVQAESAMSKIWIAGLFENNALIADAILAFQEAMRLEPQAFEETYEQFMIRNNLK